MNGTGVNWSVPVQNQLWLNYNISYISKDNSELVELYTELHECNTRVPQDTPFNQLIIDYTNTTLIERNRDSSESG